MKPLYLKLKGFKGIKYGLGKDALELDLRGYSGEVCLAGPNGSGKSTVLQNMHPYLLMPDRTRTYSQNAFSYYDECFLENSSKELIWEFDGKTYLSLVEINPVIKKTKAFLYLYDENGVPRVFPQCQDGSVESYIEMIEKILGSSFLFFTTVFRSQDAMKLSALSRSQLQDIFQELCGLGILELYIEKTRLAKSLIESEIRVRESELESLNKQLQEIPEITSSIERIKNQIVELQKAQQQKQKQHEELQETLKLLEIQLKQNQFYETQIAELNYRKEVLEKEIIQIGQEIEKASYSRRKRIQELTDKIKELEKFSQNRIALEEKLHELKLKCSNYENIQMELTKVNDLITQAVKEQQKALNIEKEISYLKDKLNKIIVATEAEIKTVTARLKQIKDQAELLSVVPCSGTEFQESCLLLKHAREASKEVSLLEKKLEELSQEKPEVQLLKQQIQEKQAQLMNCTQGDLLKELLEKKKKLENDLADYQRIKEACQAIEKDLSKIDASKEILINLNKQREQEEQSLTQIEVTLKVALTTKQNELIKIEGSLKELVSKIDSDAKAKYEETSRKLSQLLDELHKLDAQLNTLRANLSSLEGRLNYLESLKEKGINIEGTVKVFNQELSEWKLIEKVLKELIPVQIEDSGPAISELANKLLHSCFGQRFSVTIVTAIPKKTDKTQVKPTFDIYVYDSEFGEKKPLGFLSGGERIWIEEAITRAGVLYSYLSSGRTYKTIFSDERDGALDIENREKYFMMKQEFLRLGGFETEYFISHSTVATRFAQHVIDFNKLKKN